MKHYYLVTYQSKINDRIMQRIIHTSRYISVRWFNTGTNRLLSFVKISKEEAEYLGYKCD